MPGWAPCRAIGYSHPYRWCIVAWRRVRLHPCHCGRLWAKVPSSLCRHSEPRRRPLPAGTRVLVQRPVAKPEHNGKRARVLSFDARTGRYAAALDDAKKLSLKAGRVAKTGCASEEASSECARHSLRHGDSGYSASQCAGNGAAQRRRVPVGPSGTASGALRARERTSVLALTCRSAGAVRSGRLRAGAERQGSEARAQGGEERRRRPERPTWSSVQCDRAQCADQGAASTPPAARMCGRSRV